MAKTDFQPCGVITLTTDFGHKGPFVATMKGVMLSAFADAKIIDLTHETAAHFPSEAGFWLMRSFRYFPAGTTHVGVVDPGVGTDRNILALIYEGHAFVAPDNGLLAPLADRAGAQVYQVDLDAPSRFGIESISATFHGRDILAPVGAALASGRLSPEELGAVAENIVPSLIEQPTVSGGRVSGVVVAVDDFGNLMTNISSEHVNELKNPVVEAGGRRFPLRRTYADVTPGDFLGLINSFDALELARAEQSAAEGLRLGRGAPVVVREG